MFENKMYRGTNGEEVAYLCPNRVIGGTVINYLVDYYFISRDLTGGIPARNGWHVLPHIVKREIKCFSRVFDANYAEYWINTEHPDFEWEVIE